MVIPHYDLRDGASFFACILVRLKFDSVSERAPYLTFLGNDGERDVSHLSTMQTGEEKVGNFLHLCDVCSVTSPFV